MSTQQDSENNQLEQLLTFLKLNINYLSGQGDWLTYIDESGIYREVLDLSGSYGINLLGHKNDVVKSIFSGQLKPTFIQGSISPNKQKLSNQLITLISEHTQKTNWQVEFANTGTEIIEVALKLCWLNYCKKIEKIQQEINSTINYLKEYQPEGISQNEIEEQLIKIKRIPFVAHFEQSFHGKSHGSISILGNPLLAKDFPKAYLPLCLPKDPDLIKNELDKISIKYQIIDTRNGKIITKEFLPLIGLFLEPIQGEAGVFELQDELLLSLNELKKIYQFPVVADEIQCGLYRTGQFSALSSDLLIADIYCFGKQLGAGIAKISALCCRDDIYTEGFFRYHSSSFAGDEFSTRAALGFLEHCAEKISDGEISFELPLKTLSEIQKYNPRFVKEIRGKGLMCAIELDIDQINNSYITKFLKDTQLIGYWIASVLLIRCGIRVMPTLSNPYTFRIQPSIHFSHEEAKKMKVGFYEFLEALEHQDLQYLFGHILNVDKNSTTKELPKDLKKEYFPQNAAVFICHPIDSEHINQIVDLLDNHSENEINTMLNSLVPYQKFTVYHTDILMGSDGQQIPVVYLGVPITSQVFYQMLRRGQSHIAIKLIQEAIDLANKNNAKSIGLGQFTSIITKNGTLVSSSNSPLTTGNTYTALLAASAGFESWKEQKITNELPVVCVIGARGNIISSLIHEIIGNCKKIILVYRNELKEGNNTWLHFRELLIKINAENYNNPISLAIKNALNKNPDQADFSQVIMELDEVISVQHDPENEEILRSDIIFIGTNETKKILEARHIKHGCILVDIAVPSNVSDNIINSEYFTYLKGGVASLPLINEEEQHLDSVILPFEKGECYACMAETFGLALSGNTNESFIGDITPEKMRKVSKFMKEAGFSLKRAKLEKSL